MKEEFTYPGFMSSEAHKFFGDQVEYEEREGCAVVGAFIKLKDGTTKLASKGDIFLKDKNGLISLKNILKNKDLLLKMINTFAGSWGGDTPAEVYWGFNDLINFLNAEYNVSIPPLIEEQGEAIQYLIDDINRLL